MKNNIGMFFLFVFSVILIIYFFNIVEKNRLESNINWVLIGIICVIFIIICFIVVCVLFIKNRIGKVGYVSFIMIIFLVEISII